MYSKYPQNHVPLFQPAQFSLYDVINKEVVKRPTTSYIFFSKEIRPKGSDYLLLGELGVNYLRQNNFKGSAVILNVCQAFPKKNIFVYILVLEENPGASFQEIAKLIGEKWNALSPVEKGKYEELMTQDVHRYSTSSAQDR